MCHDPATQNSANEIMPRHHHLLPSNPRHLHPTTALHLAVATIIFRAYNLPEKANKRCPVGVNHVNHHHREHLQRIAAAATSNTITTTPATAFTFTDLHMRARTETRTITTASSCSTIAACTISASSPYSSQLPS